MARSPNPPVDVHQNANTSTPSDLKKSYKAGETQLNDPTTKAFVEAADQQEREKELPANQAKGGEINWLGSSYTGQDIKVVAHLYDTGSSEVDSRKKELEYLSDYQGALVFGCSKLLSGSEVDKILSLGTSHDVRKRMLDLALGFGTTKAEEDAKKYLANIVLFNPSPDPTTAASRIKNQLSILKSNATKEKASIDQHIQKLSKLDVSSSATVTLGTLQTLSVQTVREKFAVRALGHAYAKAYTRGTRTLAGSMIFTLFEEHPLSKLIRAMGESKRYSGTEVSSLIPDQIPPIDITIVFANEYGAISEQRLYGVEFVNDSTTYSIENLLSEQILQFTCRDIDILTSKGMRKLSDTQRFNNGQDDLKGTALYNSKEYVQYLEKLGVRRRLTNR